MRNAHCHALARAGRLAAVALILAGLPAPVLADDELRDPLRPPVPQQTGPQAPAINPGDWHLASTLISDGRRVAVINGRIVAPGQTVDGARVLGVARGRARLRVGEQVFTIRSGAPSIRNTSAEEPAP